MDEKQLHSLIMLAEKHSHIEFEELHKALGTKSKQELEEVLVEAIHEGTVTGKIDEKNSVFIVTSFTYPNFDKQHFELLHEYLDGLASQFRDFHGHLKDLIASGQLETVHEIDADENVEES